MYNPTINPENLTDAINALPVDIGDVAKRVHPVRLLQMPDEGSIDSLGNAARFFEGGVGTPDGDLRLANADFFSPAELADALNAGGKVVEGYRFYYPHPVAIKRNLPRIVAVGRVAVRGWCGYNDVGVGYALDRNVATAVCAASIARAKEEEEEENQD